MTGKLYAKTFALTFAFAVSMVVAGLLIVTVPELRAQSPTVTVLPYWVAIAWGASESLGGAMTIYGMWRLSPRYESAGLAILAAAQLVALVTSIVALGVVAVASGIALRGGLAIGCAVRAYSLAALR